MSGGFHLLMAAEKCTNAGDGMYQPKLPIRG
jgi:hypothetical protein